MNFSKVVLDREVEVKWAVLSFVAIPALLIACGGEKSSPPVDVDANSFSPIVTGSEKSCPKVDGTYECLDSRGNYIQKFSSNSDGSGQQSLNIAGEGAEITWILDGQIHEFKNSHGVTIRYSADCNDSRLSLNISGSGGQRLKTNITVAGPNRLRLERRAFADGKITYQYDACAKK